MFHKFFADPDSQKQLFYIRNTSHQFFVCFIFCLTLISLSLSVASFAQVTEDTTSTNRVGPPQPEERGYNNYINTPYQHHISDEAMSRYSLYGIDSNYTFFKRLRTTSPEEMLLSEEERYNRYGPDWERQLNAQLISILRETFKEQNSFLQKLARIAPFLGFGFFEEYRHPVIPRIDNNEPDVSIREP